MNNIRKIFCTNCGEAMEIDLNEIEADTIFCINCGSETDISDIKREYEEEEYGLSEDIEEAEEYPEEEYVLSEDTEESEEETEEYPEEEYVLSEDTEEADGETEENINESSPFSAAADDEKQTEHKIDLKKTSASPAPEEASPFETLSEDEKKEIDKRIGSRVKVWHEAIKQSPDNRSDFTDNFAQGMPEWDLTPPDILIIRKKVKPVRKEG